MRKFIATRMLVLFLVIALGAQTGMPFKVSRVSILQLFPTISNINRPVTCNTSVLVNFRTDVPSRAFIEYGLTTSYGSSTIDDPVRFYKEHAIQITGLSANTTYNFRITAIGGGTTQSSNQVFTTASSGATCPNLPTEVDSRMPDMTGAVEKTVKTSGGDYTPSQLQTALNDAGTASTRRIITIDAGISVTIEGVLPANADGNWIIVRTSQHAQLPEGKRVTPADASKMFKLQANSVAPVFTFAAGARNIRFIGAELTVDPATLPSLPTESLNFGLVMYQANLANNAANLPKFIGWDRCYIHGHPDKNTNRGMMVAAEDSFVIDSYMFDFHSTGFDSQAIAMHDVRRFRILNNTLVGAAEPFMWGGDSEFIDGYVVGGLEFLRNHSYHPRQWNPNAPDYAGKDWVEKNLFECKTCAQTLIFGNYFGGTTDAQGGFWVDAQSKVLNFKLEQNTGRVVSVTVTNGGSGYTSAPTVSFTANPGCVQGLCVTATASVSGGQVTGVTVTNGGLGYCIAPTVSFSGGGGSGAAATANISPQTLAMMEDIVFYKNFTKNAHGGVDVVGHTVAGSSNCGEVPEKIWFLHNVFEFDATTWNQEPGASAGNINATGWNITNTEDVQVVHNTTINATPTQSGVCNSIFGDGSLLTVGDPVTPKWTGLIFKDNVIDFRGCGVVSDGASIGNAIQALNNVYTGWVFTNNGIMRTGGTPSNFPTGNLFQSSYTGLFANFNSGLDGNYRVAAGSAWDNAASDGTDLGADVDGVELATEFSPTGNWAGSSGPVVCKWNTNPPCQ